MEIRKIQLTGGSSFAMTLPKKWIDQVALHNKDEVVVYLQKSGVLVVQPARIKDGLLKAVLPIDGLSKDMISRELIGHYICGSDEVIIKGKNIAYEERERIRQVLQSLLGYEIIEESSQEIFIKNIFDATKFPVIQNVEKMFAITKLMFSDAIASILQNNIALARDVIGRDFEIDKLQMAIMRQFYTLIRGKVFDEQLGLSQADLTYYETIAVQLERIADHAVKIAKSLILINKKIQADTSAHLKHITNKVIPLLGDSETMVKKLNKQLAHTILDKNTNLEKALLFDGKVTSFQQIVVIDSLDRLRGYIMNMAEITIDQVIAKQ
jgi:phosphate uptake regulator